MSMDMNGDDQVHSSALPVAAGLPNGSGAAAILAAAMGSFVFAVLAFAGDKSTAIKAGLAWYKPTGALSGVSTAALLVWFASWALLEWRWRNRTVALRAIVFCSFALMALSLLLTFPPVVDLL